MPRTSRPHDFRGRFDTEPATLDRHATSSGPVFLRPRALAVPIDGRDLAALLRWVTAEGHAIVPRAGATGMPGGNVGPHIAVDMKEAFSFIDPPDLELGTIRVGAGAIAGDVARAAERKGLFLPPLPSSADRCTIGGMIANNAAGARTFGYGATCDWIDALSLVTADGQRLRFERGRPVDVPIDLPSPEGPTLEAWPDVRKNSSGYALDRYQDSGNPIDLLIGSEGTLGLVTEATVRLTAIPEVSALVLVSCPALTDVVEWAHFAREAGAKACEFLGRRLLTMARLEHDTELGSMSVGQAALVLIELAGEAGVVASQVDLVEARARSVRANCLTRTHPEDTARLWGLRKRASPVIEEAQALGMRSMQFIEDCVVPVDRLDAFLQRLHRILDDVETEAVIFGHAGDGNPHVNPLIDTRRPDWRDRVRAVLSRTAALVAELGGTMSGEHGDGRVRAPFLDTIWTGAQIERFQEVKRAFDPLGILNPGVILPIPGQDPLDGFGAGSPLAPPKANSTGGVV